MMANIVSISERIRDFVAHLEESNRDVKNIAESITTLATRIDGQTSFIGRATASVEQMTSSIRSVATITSQREEATATLVQTTKAGGTIIEETAASILNIVKDLGKIMEVVGIIDNILVKRTLAMNAAIEAAHAGLRPGRGFAVVAEGDPKARRRDQRKFQKHQGDGGGYFVKDDCGTCDERKEQEGLPGGG